MANDKANILMFLRSERIDTEDNVEQSETANEEVMKQATEEGRSSFVCEQGRIGIF